MSANWLDEAIEQAWTDYEHKRVTDAPYEYVEAAAETLFILLALRQSIHLQAERAAEVFREVAEQILPRLGEWVRELAEGFMEVLKDVNVRQRQQSKPPGDHPSHLTRAQARAKGRPQGVRAGSVGFNTPATVRR